MSIEKRVIEIINENIEEHDITVDLTTSLKEDLGLDSLNMVMILNALEAEFDIQLDEEEVFGMESVGLVVDSLKSRLKKGE